MFLLFLGCGVLTVVVALAIGDVLVLLVSQILLVAAFLGAARFATRNPRWARLSGAFYAYFVFATIVLIREIPLALLSSQGTSSPFAQALVPVADTVVVVALVLVLAKASGRPLSSLFLRRGNLRQGLLIGIPALVGLYLAAIVSFEFIFATPGNGISFAKLLSLSPEVLVLAALNAPKEELWFRGLFLQEFEPLFGRGMSNLLQAPAFMLAHVVPQYAQVGIPFLLSFLGVVFVMGLIWGYLMQRTGSLLAPSLVHIGADVFIFMAIVLSLL